MTDSNKLKPTQQAALPVGLSRRVKTFTACAAGSSLALPVCFLVLPRLAIDNSPFDPRLGFLVACLVFVPIILAIVFLTRQATAGGDLVSITRRYRLIPLTFSVSWLSIAGYLLISALLIKVMGRYLRFFLEQSTQLDIPEPMAMLLVAVIALSKETFVDRKWWGTRAAFNLICLGTLLATVIHQISLNDFTQEFISASAPFDRSGAIFGVLAAALWGVDSILTHRGEMRDGSRAAAIATTTSTVVALLCGALMVCLQFSAPNTFHKLTNLNERWANGPGLSIGVAAALVLCFAGLFRAINHTTRSTALILPQIDNQEKKEKALRHLVVLLTLTAATAAAIYPSRLALAAAAGATYFWALGLSVAPVLFSRQKAALLLTGDAAKWLRPIAYALVLVAIYVTSLLPWSLTGGVIFWLVLGLVTYALLNSWQQTEKNDEEVAPQESLQDVEGEAVVGVVTQSANWESLARSLHLLAKSSQRRAVILEKFSLDEVLGIREQSKRARRRLRMMQAQLTKLFPEGTRVQPLVRLGNTTAEVLHSLEEETQLSLIVLHIDSQKEKRADVDLEDVEEIFQSFDDPVALLYGRCRLQREQLGLVIKRTCDIRAVAELARSFQESEQPLKFYLPEALHADQDSIVDELKGRNSSDIDGDTQTSRPQSSEIENSLQSSAQLLDNKGNSNNTEVSSAQSAALKPANISAEFTIIAHEREGISLAEQKNSAFFLLESAYDSVIGRSVFGGPPLELARKRSGLTIIYKPKESSSHYLWRRITEFVTDFVPSLTDSDRAQILSDQARSARGSKDFFFLMVVASVIAISGLLADSTAVVIGAMLVAPLMQPIIGLALGIAVGSRARRKRSIRAITRGAAAAVGVAVVICLLFPIHDASREVMARTSPNLLDLIVALAAGAAGSYGTARKSIAGAIPGVAISVALVPPLCVVGFGIATGSWPIAWGATLLFITNLAGIVLVSTQVFMVFGFRPLREEQSQTVRLGLLASTGLLFLVAIPLAISTFSSYEARLMTWRVHRAEEKLESSAAIQIESFNIVPQDGHFQAEAHIYSEHRFEEIHLDRLRDQIQSTALAVRPEGLTSELRRQLEVRLVIIDAQIYQKDGR